MKARGKLAGLSRPDRLAADHPAFVPAEIKRVVAAEQLRRRRLLWLRWFILAAITFFFVWAFAEVVGAANEMREASKAGRAS